MNYLELAVIKQISVHLKNKRLREDPYLKDTMELQKDCIVEAVCRWWHANLNRLPSEEELQNMKPMMEEILNMKPRANGMMIQKRKFIG